VEKSQGLKPSQLWNFPARPKPRADAAGSRGASLETYGKAIAAALATGAGLFATIFAAMHFAWLRFVVSDASEVARWQGVMAVGAGLAIGAILAMTGTAGVLLRFWPRRTE
jgi:hypothetical protein